MADITELIFSKAAELVTIAGFEKITIGFAESLTGGLISSSVVAVPGASAVFKGSVVSYTNEVKEGVLGVPSGIISAYTEVSAECAKAMAEGAFKREIVPVEIKKKKETVLFDTDENPRAGITAEGLARMRAINPDGYVTAGNASGINDGAAAIVVMSEEKAKELGVKPMATFVAGALAGVAPEIMGVGPVAATKKVMAKAGYKIEDFDVIEANEAFAAQSVAVGKDLGIDVEKQLNPRGGAIALGHPVGASGCRILVTLLHEMEDMDLKKGLATLCIGGGMGCATIVERD